MTEKLSIALLAGGDSSEREIALQSAARSIYMKKHNVCE